MIASVAETGPGGGEGLVIPAEVDPVRPCGKHEVDVVVDDERHVPRAADLEERFRVAPAPFGVRRLVAVLDGPDPVLDGARHGGDELGPGPVLRGHRVDPPFRPGYRVVRSRHCGDPFDLRRIVRHFE